MIDITIATIILNEFGLDIASEDMNINDDVVKVICQTLRMYVLQKISDRNGLLSAQWLLSKIEVASEDVSFTYFKEMVRKELLQTDAYQDKLVINMAKNLIDLMQRSKSNTQNTVTVNGSIGRGSAIGSNPVVTNIFNPPESPKDEVREGKICLVRGKENLEMCDFEMAKKNLDVAVSKLHEDSARKEAARAKYFLAIALLDGKRPFSQKQSVIRSVENLLRSAITLHLAQSYVVTLALCKRDFARNGLPQLENEANELMVKASSINQTSEDVENLKLLKTCQPNLAGDYFEL